jgi:hypothetical protein
MQVMDLSCRLEQDGTQVVRWVDFLRQRPCQQNAAPCVPQLNGDDMIHTEPLILRKVEATRIKRGMDKPRAVSRICQKGIDTGERKYHERCSTVQCICKCHHALTGGN